MEKCLSWGWAGKTQGEPELLIMSESKEVLKNKWVCQQDTGPPEVVKAGMLLAINKKKLDYNPKFKINIHRDK